MNKWSVNFSAVSDSATPWTIQSLWFFRPEYWRGQPIPSPVDLPNPGIEPRSLPLQEDSLPAEPPGKPKNTGVDSLSLLQGIFLTQEWNWRLLYCRQILYQQSFQGNSESLKKPNQTPQIISGFINCCWGSFFISLPVKKSLVNSCVYFVLKMY